MKLPYKLAVLLHKLSDAGCGPVRPQGDEFRCRCPAHDDHGPSLYVGLAEDRILVRCNAGCDARAVCDRLDHPLADLFFDADEPLVEADGEPDAGGAPEAASVNGQAAAGGTAPADPSFRRAAYEGLLARLELSTAHFDALRQRGLPAAEIASRQYRTLDAGRLLEAVDGLLAAHGPEALLTVPGFVERNGRVRFQAAAGLLVPVRDVSGAVAALKVRHDAGHPGPKYAWASSPQCSCGNPAHVPLGVAGPAETVRLTEGEIKGDVATWLSGLSTVSAPGVTSWAVAVPVLQALGARRVLLAFDRDGKPGTLAATEQALLGLTRAGFEATVEWWAGPKGIDDLLAAGGQPEVLGGLEALVRLRDLQAGPAAGAADAAEPAPAAFPLAVLPPALAAYVEQAARATATPPDFAGVTLLVTAGAALGNSRALCLNDHTWYEAARFYAALVGDPGSGKTPAMQEVTRHYEALQFGLLDAYKAARAAYESALAEHEQAVKENRALPPAERGPLPPPPAEPPKPARLVTIDATVESLAVLLEENPRGLLMTQDEGVAWVRAMGQYKGGRGADRQFWLSAWSGRSHLVDRKGQGVVPVTIPRPFVNVICGVQPDMLGELADHQGRDDGFLDRLLFVLPPAAAGADWSEATVAPHSQQAWAATLGKLRGLAMEELHGGALGYQVVRLSAAAKEAWVSWWDGHAAEIRGPDLPAALIGPWGKLKSYAARLALVLHFLWLVQGDGDEGEMGADSVARAVQLINYFKSHLRLVYGRLRQTPEDNQLFDALDWIRQHGGQCTARQLVRAHTVTPTAAARKMLTELAERGYGRLEWREAANGHKVQWFVFEPG
jgi:hypothetical protein